MALTRFLDLFGVKNLSVQVGSEDGGITVTPIAVDSQGRQLVVNTASFLEASASLDFPSTAAAASSDLTITVTGAAVNDPVSMGLPAAPTAGIVFNAFVSAANTVTIRATNITAAPVDPAAATYKVRVFK